MCGLQLYFGTPNFFLRSFTNSFVHDVCDGRDKTYIGANIEWLGEGFELLP